MNPNLQSAIRSLLLAAGAGLVTNGSITSGELQQVVGLALSVGSVIWSQIYHASNPPAPVAYVQRNQAVTSTSPGVVVMPPAANAGPTSAADIIARRFANP